MLSLLLLTATLTSLLLAGGAIWLMYQLQLRLLRIFCVKQEIPVESMEPRKADVDLKVEPKPKNRIRVPVPQGWVPSDFRRQEGANLAHKQ